ncbi:MAG: c-type cytochrome [Verrucomicrobiae bacterium]|nr:c-type cytochrome [Verrucomicrobiae bacterium]
MPDSLRYLSAVCFLIVGTLGSSLAEETPPLPPPGGQLPLDPEAALASIRVRPGLRVELVAAEPLVMDPVSFDWGPDGRLWVAEMRDYPNGFTWNGAGDPLDEAGGKIKVLTDTDGDGRFDKADVFLDGLHYPTSVKVWNRGVLVTAAPEIFYAEDTDGDGKADRRETWYDGFARSNQQHRVNSLAWGLDNWLHLANGDGGGLILSRETRDAVDIRGLDLKIDPFTRELQPLLGRTQCGRYRDDWGNWFGCNNSNPLWHYPLSWEYLRRNPDLQAPRAYVDVPREPGAAPVFPISETVERFNDFSRANRFTSACGPTIYRDTFLGDDLSGNAFVCEPVHNLVSRQVLKPKGATFASDRAPEEQASEFFASSDSWSRPVSVKTGPDGALWIADMYRLVIEHPEWIPQDWQEKLDLRAGNDRGRIYRVIPTDGDAPKIPLLDELDDAALVAQLENPNGTVRDLVHQMLLWRSATEVVSQLRNLVRTGEHPTARLHALCVLDGLGKLDADTIHVALTDESARVVRQATRLSPGYVEAAEMAEFILPKLDDAFVALELAGVLGTMKGEEASRLLAALLLRYRDEPYVTAVALSSVNHDNLEAIIAQLALAYDDPTAFREHLSRFDPSLEAPPFSLTQTLARFAVKWECQPAIDRLVATLADTAGKGQGPPPPWQISLLTGLLDQARSLEEITSDAATANLLRNLAADARSVVAADSLPAWQRAEAIRLLGSPAVFNGAPDFDLLIHQLSPKADPALREAIFETLTRTRYPATASALLARWNSLPPSDRSVVLGLALSRGEWTEDLLSTVESGAVPRNQIDAANRRRLLESANEDFQKRAKVLFAAASNATREQVLADWHDVLEMEGDPVRGKSVFATVCVACHVADGIGNAVGPDLAALTDRSPDALLVAVLDPNRAVEDKFLTWTISGNDGDTRLGLIADESANSFTLRQTDGSETSVLRSEIRSMTSTGISLMPEGLEATLTKAQLADLIAYVGSLGGAPEPALDMAARVRPGRDGVIELRASKCRIAGERLEYMPDFDALGWWTSEKDRAQWTVVLDRPGHYRIEWEYSVAPEAAGNAWKLMVNGRKASGGKVASSGNWETFVTGSIGEIELPAADNKVVLQSDGPVTKALLDLRAIRFIPIEP